MDNLGNKAIQLMTQGFIVVFCICFGALVILSGDSIDTMENQHEPISSEINEL